MPSDRAWITLISKFNYIQAALVLEQSIRDVDSRFPLVVMTMPGLPEIVYDIFRVRNIQTRAVQLLKPAPGRHKVDPHDERFNETWGKLRCFDMVEYKRVILLDSDTIMRRNMDELMDIELPGHDWIAAVHACACNPMNYPHYPKDWIPSNCGYTPLTHPQSLTYATPILHDSPRPYNLLNSGLVVLTPSKDVMQELEEFVRSSPLIPGFKFPDQDLLATVFKGRWKPLPWKYNALKTLKKIHSQCWRDEEIRMLHYILHDKPWHYRRGEGPLEYEYMNIWWYETFDRVIADLKTHTNGHWEAVQAEVAA